MTMLFRRAFGCLLAAIFIAESVLAGEEPISVGTTVRLRSQVLAEDRQLLISLPTGYESSTARYPVLYLLEGNTHFLPACAITRFYSELSVMPPMIVVGIRNVHRNRDLTPASTDPTDLSRFPGAGGSARFLSFLATELKPFVDSHYRTEPYTIVAGHSLGGLFVVHTLLNNPDTFDAYIAMSPSLWWDHGAVVEKAREVLVPDRSLARTLFLTHGSEEVGIVTGVHGMMDILKYYAPISLKWGFAYLPQDDHGATPFRSLLEGLEFIYKNWQLKAIYADLSIEDYRAHYRRLTEEFGYVCRPTESFINRQAYRRLRSGRIEDALDLFKYNVENYPGSANVYDSLAEGYVAAGDINSAVANYEKSIELNSDNANAIKRLKELRTKIR